MRVQCYLLSDVAVGFFISVVFSASKMVFTRRFPRSLRAFTWRDVHSSNSMERTRDTCVPRDRCTPEHRIQMRQPNVNDTHCGSAEQMLDNGRDNNFTELW